MRDSTTRHGNPDQVARAGGLTWGRSQTENPGPMVGKTRDEKGYSLGRTRSLQVAQRVREVMSEKGVTQAEISARTARAGRMIPTSHLSVLLNGGPGRFFQRWQVALIADALEVDEMRLLPAELRELANSAPSEVQHTAGRIATMLSQLPAGDKAAMERVVKAVKKAVREEIGATSKKSAG